MLFNTTNTLLQWLKTYIDTHIFVYIYIQFLCHSWLVKTCETPITQLQLPIHSSSRGRTVRFTQVYTWKEKHYFQQGMNWKLGKMLAERTICYLCWSQQYTHCQPLSFVPCVNVQPSVWGRCNIPGRRHKSPFSELPQRFWLPHCYLVTLVASRHGHWGRAPVCANFRTVSYQLPKLKTQIVRPLLFILDTDVYLYYALVSWKNLLQKAIGL